MRPFGLNVAGVLGPAGGVAVDDGLLGATVTSLGLLTKLWPFDGSATVAV